MQRSDARDSGGGGWGDEIGASTTVVAGGGVEGGDGAKLRADGCGGGGVVRRPAGPVQMPVRAADPQVRPCGVHRRRRRRGPQPHRRRQLGDSRAVLCRNGAPVPLSSDNKPDRPDELERIQAAGGWAIYWEGVRVLEVLAMSRAIGDSYLKPYVISEPEVSVTEREEGDECLILASDGLWDVVTNETACDIARMCLRSGAPAAAKACSDAAMLLTKLALARQSADNVSVIVIDLRRRRN